MDDRLDSTPFIHPQGLYAAFHALLDHGDEAILMEPAFDIYSAQIKMAGGKCVYVPLRPPDATSPKGWHLDWDDFERAFTERTRLVVLNTPHNPTGKVFRREELERIAAIVQRHPRVGGWMYGGGLVWFTLFGK